MQVDVITAAHRPHAGFVASAWKSVRSQTGPDWTWRVQIDGPPDEVLTALDDCGALRDDRVDVGVNGTGEGPAVTRNVALGRAGAPLVQNLDIDDELETGALAALARALEAHPTAGYTFGRARDLLADGSLEDHRPPLLPGQLRRGQLVENWAPSSAGYTLPAHPAGVMWRRSLLLALGGWPAFHRMEDTALLLAGSAAAPGHFVDRPTLRYRKHPHQTSATPTAFRGGGEQIRLVQQWVHHLIPTG